MICVRKQQTIDDFNFWISRFAVVAEVHSREPMTDTGTRFIKVFGLFGPENLGSRFGGL